MNVVKELRLYLECDVLINPDPEESAQVIQDALGTPATPLQYLNAICKSGFCKARISTFPYLGSHPNQLKIKTNRSHNVHNGNR